MFHFVHSEATRHIDPLKGRELIEQSRGKGGITPMDGDFGVTGEDVLDYTEGLESHTDHIPADEREASLDRALASCAISVALRRHAGFYAQESDPVMKNCPIEAIVAGEENGQKYVRITDKCVECNICRRVCPFGAIENADQTEGIVQCSSCSIQCKVPAGSTGACKRYTNEGGKLVRNRALVLEPKPQVEVDEKIRKPIITAVGAGTNYPCIRPAPHIVCEKRDGVDVVTTVTEAPLSYSGVLVKLDTNTYIGEEGATVYRDGKPVGMVQTEEYGSKMIYVGGANRLTAKDGGFVTARTICELANGEEVELAVDKKIKIRCQQGKAPVINGVQEQTMHDQVLEANRSRPWSVFYKKESVQGVFKKLFADILGQLGIEEVQE